MEAAPFYAEAARGPDGGQAVWWTAPDGAKLRLGHWPAAGRARGTVLLFPGRSEYLEKYGPTAAVICAAGWHIVTVDWRGQGLSGRGLPDRMLGHIEDFADYQHDVAALLAFVAALGLPEPLNLISHSMGGCIALRSLLAGLDIQSAVFSAPMWGIRLFPTVTPMAVNLAAVMHRSGQGHRLTPTTTRASYVLHTGFRGNMLTRDPEMWGWMRQHLIRHPDLALGGPSLTWLHAAFTEMRALDGLASPACPALAAVGSAERIICTRAIRRRMARWPGARQEVYPNAEHEVMMEVPRHRDRFHQSCLTLFDRPLSTAQPEAQTLTAKSG